MKYWIARSLAIMPLVALAPGRMGVQKGAGFSPERVERGRVVSHRGDLDPWRCRRHPTVRRRYAPSMCRSRAVIGRGTRSRWARSHTPQTRECCHP